MRKWTWYFRCFNRLVSRYQPRLPRRFPEELFWEIFTGRMPFLSPAQECGRFQTPSPTNSLQLSGTPTILPHSTDNFRRPSTGYLHLINCQCVDFFRKRRTHFRGLLSNITFSLDVFCRDSDAFRPCCCAECVLFDGIRLSDRPSHSLTVSKQGCI